MLASSKGNIEVVKVLLDKGADANAKNKDGGTALMLAAQDGNLEVVKLLKARGATE